MTATPLTLKPFQWATVRHVLGRLEDPTGSCRFLVADEVGLGKTRVAQGVLHELCQGRHLNVFYVCSSQSIAHQNREDLLEILPPDRRAAARVEVDRLTLIPEAAPRTTDAGFTLYTLTPGTLPLKGGGRGRYNERAALWALLSSASPDVAATPTIQELLRHGVNEKTWDAEVERRQIAPNRSRAGALGQRMLTQLAADWRLPGASGPAFAKELRCRLTADPNRTIRQLRRHLSLLALADLRPDLVILDEFQRFFEWLRSDPPIGPDATDPEEGLDEEAAGLVRLLLGAHDNGLLPAILLLSATPYRLYSGGGDDGKLGHYHQFFQLLQFLYGTHATGRVAELKGLFAEYRRRLRRDAPGSPDVLAVRDRLTHLLVEVMLRTERASLFDGRLGHARPDTVRAALDASDVRLFEHLWRSVQPEHQAFVPAVWSSIPCPLQMMDLGYVVRAKADPQPVPPALASDLLDEATVRCYQRVGLPHPRLRALLAEIGPHLPLLPWMPPTLPWWPLGGRFAEAPDSGLSKLLIFSRYRAVPRAIASLVSYEMERALFAPRGPTDPGYDYRRAIDVQDDQSALRRQPRPSFRWTTGDRQINRTTLLSFVPGVELARLGDPRGLLTPAGDELSQGRALDVVRQALRGRISALPSKTVLITPGARPGMAWRAAARLEGYGQGWGRCRAALRAWGKAGGNDSAVQEWITAADSRDPVEIREGDLSTLAEFALLGPANVLLRAASRVFANRESADDRYRLCLGIATGAMRGYLDQPDLHLAMRAPDQGEDEQEHPRAVRQAVWDGNLESVLDEYLAIQAGLGVAEPAPGRQERALGALEAALSIRTSSIDVRPLAGGDPFKMRCHVAMPLGLTPGDVEAEPGGKLRADFLRVAFNAPFRPFVLATTSIGQEGLDFHTYCAHVVHWDLPPTPVELEQRDGRVNRYGGLAVRRALLARAPVPRVCAGESPWRALSLAQVAGESEGGLVPWWGLEGMDLRRTVLLPPLSRQERDLVRLLSALSHYRLTLGQPDQEQLVRALNRRLPEDPRAREEMAEWLRSAQINLSPPLLPHG